MTMGAASSPSIPRQALDALRRSLRELCFNRRDADGTVPAVGVEVEAIPIHAKTGDRIPLEGRTVSTLQIVRALAARRGWRERRSAKGTPYFSLPAGTLSFEPGGQVELSADPVGSLTGLTGEVEKIFVELEAAAASHGAQLLGVGIDPVATIDQVPLQLDAERYVRMAAYLETVSSYGARMMRQTASIQVSLDPGPDPSSRWTLLNNLVPFVLAIFANSPRYGGVLTAHQSYRAHCWRVLDPARTGIRGGRAGEDMVESYLAFALGAPDLMRRNPAGAYQPFAAWAEQGQWNVEQWETHLSTLFPEVRPRGHFEVRSADALPREWTAVPAAFLCGLAYDDLAAAEAVELAHDSAELLVDAGRRGLQHPRIRTVAADLARLSLEGARRLGDAYVDGGTLERAAAFYEKYTLRGRSPADDSRDNLQDSSPPVRRSSAPVTEAS